MSGKPEKKPRITVITVVYNGEKHLEETIRSVINQTYVNVEYIIIDGGSTDGTLDIIKRYEEKIDYWVSEPDKGIYDAMNKGLACATGDYVAFMNADDWYEPDALEAVADAIVKTEADFITANIRIIDEETKESVIRYSTFDEYGKNIHHQTCFINLSLHKQFPFNTQYQLAADRDLIVRVIKSGVATHFIDKVVANFREGGKGSNMLKYQIELFDSNAKNVGILFALKRFALNMTGRTLLNLLKIKR
ncbi:glycosyltransferase family 2 protein [Sulfurimonas sp. HSL3-7]|uniref:glycosyltransferase family 2 protein n=1 Tax=Sulfonitrofixus jiaomeiensis TaxID=3131938 RepID=UPI0031F89E49